MGLKQILSAKLSDNLLELRLRSKDASLPELQLLFGICLGFRSALIELNMQAGENPQDFPHAVLLFDLIRQDMKSLQAWRNFQWPH